MPLHAWMIRGRHTRRAYVELKKTEFASREILREIQNSRLKEIVNHAYSTSLFYKQNFDRLGIHPNDVTSVDQISSLPLLSKSDVRDNLEIGLISNTVPTEKRLKINTSGSTGQPFTLFADQQQLEVRFAATLRALEQTGWRFGDRQARLWHQTLGMSKSQVVREHIDAWFLKRLFIPAFEVTPANIEQFVAQIRNHKPVLVDGYAESLNFLASYAQTGASPNFVPKAIMSSAQALPRSTRDVIERAFHTKVFDKYGSREFSGIAYECNAHRNHHVVDECYIVELLVDNRPAMPGEVGEVVITDLFNRATPMIRYRIGDLAVAVDNSQVCACGRSHSQIGDIEGRTQAVVHCANGRWLPGTFFAHFFKDYDSIIKFFQIEQHVKGAFTLRIVPAQNFTESGLESAILKLREYVGGSTIDIQKVAEIPMVRTGKRSPVTSHVTEDFQSLSTSTQIRIAPQQ
jgi:phenylacetate-CoA ligase